MLLAEKKALVTGCSRGIGKAIVSRFLEEGCSVWGICTKPSAARVELDAIATQHNTQFYELYADCSDTDMLTKTVQQTLHDAQGFDIVVNNAGIARDGLSFRMTTDDWNNVLAVNLTAAFTVCKIICSDMIRKRSGSVINISSIVGLHGQAGQVNYAASKAGLIGLTKSLAKETATRGVRVNAIAPGYIETDMTAAVSEKMRNIWVSSIPLNRAGTPADVANAAVFLASDMSTYITGHVMGVDGGLGA